MVMVEESYEKMQVNGLVGQKERGNKEELKAVCLLVGRLLYVSATC